MSLDNRQRLCIRFKHYVTAACLIYGPVSSRQAEPGFSGSATERDLIADFIDRIDAKMKQPFLTWCHLRARDAGALPGGHKLPAHRETPLGWPQPRSLQPTS